MAEENQFSGGYSQFTEDSQLFLLVKHAFRSLLREKRRSLFATFAIAVGVVAIVGLQSLALSIDDSITGDIQSTHQADIVVSTRDDNAFTSQQHAQLDALTSEGRFSDWTFFYWVNPDRPSFVASFSSSGRQGLQWLQPYLVEPHKYPLYGEVEIVQPKGANLKDLLAAPGSIVLSQSIANRIDVGPGDEVILENSNTFTVRGVAADRAAGGFFAPYFVPPLPWFGYLNLEDPKAQETFAVGPGSANLLFIKTDKAGAEGLARLIEARTGNTLEVETAAERLPDLENLTSNLGKVIIVVGLVSLAIGGIGILNTMLVVVGRRTMEIATLKALGLKGRQIVLLLLIEGALLGAGGSIIGVAGGIAISYVLTGFGEGFLAAEIPWKLHAASIYTGLIVGVIVTMVFAFLPILSASRIRPNSVLQPHGSVIPRTGRIISLITIIFLAIVIGLVASWFLESLWLGVVGTAGALVVLFLLSLILRLIVWAVGKAPSFGSIDLKMSLRGLSRQKGRAASTLLALVIGLFAMSSIVILSDTMKDLVDRFVEEEASGNILVIIPGADLELRDRVAQKITSTEEVASYLEIQEFRVDSLRVNGRAIPRDQLEAWLDWRDLLVLSLGSSTGEVSTVELAEGRHLRPEDTGKPVVMAGPARPWLHAGDTLTVSIGERQIGLEIVGVSRDSDPLDKEFVSSGGNLLAPIGALGEGVVPSGIGFALTAPSSRTSEIASEINQEVPRVIAVDIGSFSSVFKETLDRFTIFPLILSGLALFAGAVIIANSVALATLERRREIALMKAVGAKGSRVLIYLLMENGILGLVGGAIGIGLTLVVLVLFHQLEPEIPISVVPLSVITVLAIAVAIALGAAILSAWPASKERPLTVLRYE